MSARSSSRILISIPLLIVVLITPPTASAQPVAANCTATLTAPSPAVSLFVLPNGTGSPFTACWPPPAFSPRPVAASVDVVIRDAAGAVLAGVPRRDIRIAEAGTGMNWCPDTLYPPPLHAPNCADNPTDGAGRAQFTLAYHGGGWHSSGMQVWVREGSGLFAPIPMTLNVRMNSADITGDRVVNLSDVAMFVPALGATPPPYYADFNWDGTVNLPDIIYMATSLGVSCP